MAFPASTERWRGVVQEVLPDLPVDLVLAIVQAESRGQPGRVSGKATRAAYTAEEIRSCGLAPGLARRALGLMQVVASTWRSFNEDNPGQVTPCDLASRGDRGVRGQLLVGGYALRRALAWSRSVDPIAHPWPAGPLTEDQARWSDLVYAQGRGGVEDMIARGRAAGVARDLDALEKWAPRWGSPEHPWRHSRHIAALATSGGESRGVGRALLDPGEGLPWGLAILALLWWIQRKEKKRPRDTEVQEA